MDTLISWGIKLAAFAAVCAALWFAGNKLYHAATDPFVQEGIQIQLAKDEPQIAAKDAEIVGLKAQIEKLTGESKVLSDKVAEMSAANVKDAADSAQLLADSHARTLAAEARAAKNNSKVQQLQAEASGPPAPAKDANEKLNRVGSLLRDGLAAQRVR